MWRRRTIEFDWWGGGVAAAAGCRFVPKDKETRTGNLASGKRTCHIKFLCGPLGTNAAAHRCTARPSRHALHYALFTRVCLLSSRALSVPAVVSRLTSL